MLLREHCNTDGFYRLYYYRTHVMHMLSVRDSLNWVHLLRQHSMMIDGRGGVKIILPQRVVLFGCCSPLYVK